MQDRVVDINAYRFWGVLCSEGGVRLIHSIYAFPQVRYVGP